MIVAVLDARVLYPPSLRDLLMRLAASGIYSPRWTSQIQNEWVRNVIADNPLITQQQLDRTCSLMEQVDRNCVVCGYEERIQTVNLPDPNDRHVLAAAIEAAASYIVTYNLADFPSQTLQTYGIKAVHPDVFLDALLSGNAETFIETLRRHRSALKNLPKDIQAYIDTLKANGLLEVAGRIEDYRDRI